MKNQTIKEIVLGPRQMTFGFDDEGQQKQDRVVSLIVEQVETHGRAVLDLFVATAEQQLNLTQIDILQTIFWSAHELKIQFRVDGKNLPPFETKQVLLKTPAKCVELITNKSVEDPIFQDVTCFYQNIFTGENKNVFHDQYDFSRSVLWDLKRWETNLNSFLPIAKKPFYPGGKVIFENLQLLKKLLARQDSYSLIYTCYNNKEKIAKMADDVKIISKFYTRQAKFWGLMIQSLNGFKPNLAEIKKNNDIFSKFKRLTRIIASPEPYDRITEAESLLKTVQTHNDLIVEEKTNARRETSLKKIDTMIEKLMKLFNRHSAGEDLRNKFLYALRKEKKKLVHTKTISQIDQVLYNTQDLFDDFVEEIEDI